MAWMKRCLRKAPIDDQLQKAGFQWLTATHLTAQEPPCATVMMEDEKSDEMDIFAQASFTWNMQYFREHATQRQFLLCVDKLPRTNEAFHSSISFPTSFGEDFKDLSGHQQSKRLNTVVAETVSMILETFPFTFALFLDDAPVWLDMVEKTVVFRVNFATASNENLDNVSFTRFWI